MRARTRAIPGLNTQWGRPLRGPAEPRTRIRLSRLVSFQPPFLAHRAEPRGLKLSGSKRETHNQTIPPLFYSSRSSEGPNSNSRPCLKGASSWGDLAGSERSARGAHALSSRWILHPCSIHTHASSPSSSSSSHRCRLTVWDVMGRQTCGRLTDHSQSCGYMHESEPRYAIVSLPSGILPIFSLQFHRL